MKKVVAAILASALSTPALAADWRVAAGVSRGDSESVYFVDVESIRRSGDTVRFWSHPFFEKPLAKGVNHATVLQDANCTEKSARQLSVTYYRDGDVVQIDAEKDAMQYYPPGTVVYNMIECVCAQDYLTETVDDPEAFAKAEFARP